MLISIRDRPLKTRLDRLPSPLGRVTASREKKRYTEIRWSRTVWTRNQSKKRFSAWNGCNGWHASIGVRADPQMCWPTYRRRRNAGESHEDQAIQAHNLLLLLLLPPGLLAVLIGLFLKGSGHRHLEPVRTELYSLLRRCEPAECVFPSSASISDRDLHKRISVVIRPSLTIAGIASASDR